MTGHFCQGCDAFVTRADQCWTCHRCRGKHCTCPKKPVSLWAILALVVLLLASPAWAQHKQTDPSAAVFRMTSHGGSGTWIATGDGWTLGLTCKHCFADAAAQERIIVIDSPAPQHAVSNWKLENGRMAFADKGADPVGFTLVAVSKDTDLALILYKAGPMPYITPVAVQTAAVECWSAGYDKMTDWPAIVRPAKITKVGGAKMLDQKGGYFVQDTFTDASPFHGRSGGALIDKRTGELVGVVNAYTCIDPRYQLKSNNPLRRDPYKDHANGKHEFRAGENGVYASHQSILEFLNRVKAKGLIDMTTYTPPSCTVVAVPQRSNGSPGQPQAPYRPPGGT